VTSELMAMPVDPATYPDVMDLTRGESGRRPLPTGS
jgi:hypothetical protein